MIDQKLWERCWHLIPTKTKRNQLPLYLGEIEDGINVFLVDGNQVKIDFDMDFVEGCNGEECEYIPKDEIWLDHLMSVELPYILYHEAYERRLMSKGMKYDEAHEEANKSEKVLRKRSIEGKCPWCGAAAKTDGKSWWCSKPPCEWSLFSAGADSHMEKSFTGAINDTLGRKRCYRNGLPISCNSRAKVGSQEVVQENEHSDTVNDSEKESRDSEEIANNDVSEYPYSQEELSIEQNWHKEFIAWALANGPSEIDGNSIIRFVTSLLNPAMGGYPYIESLAEQNGINMGETEFSQILYHGFKWMLNDEETGMAAAKLAGNLFGDAAIAIFQDSSPPEERSTGDDEIPSEEMPSHVLGGGLRGLRRVGGRFSNLSHDEIGHRLRRSHEIRKNRRLHLQIDINSEGEIEGQAIEKSLPYHKKANVPRPGFREARERMRETHHARGQRKYQRRQLGSQRHENRMEHMRNDRNMYISSHGSDEGYEAFVRQRTEDDKKRRQLGSEHSNVIKKPSPTSLQGRESGRDISLGRHQIGPKHSDLPSTVIEGRRSGDKKALSTFNELSGGALIGGIFKIPKNPKLKRSLLNSLLS